MKAAQERHDRTNKESLDQECSERAEKTKRAQEQRPAANKAPSAPKK